jgi:hypothetical protein
MTSAEPPNQYLGEQRLVKQDRIKQDRTDQVPLADAVVGRTYRVAVEKQRPFNGTVVNKTDTTVMFKATDGPIWSFALDTGTSTVKLFAPTDDLAKPAVQEDVALGGRRRKSRRRRSRARKTRRRN